MAAVQVRSGGRSHRDAVFASVFPPHDHTTPTPEATPSIGILSSPGAPFGGFDTDSDPVSEAANVNRAWSTVTRFLAIPPGLQSSKKSQQGQPAELASALAFLLSQENAANELRKWCLEEIRAHLQGFVLPELRAWNEPIAIDSAAAVLRQTIDLLQQAQNLYLDKLNRVKVNSSSRVMARDFADRVKQGLHLLVLHSLPSDRVQKTLASYWFHSMKQTLQNSPSSDQCLSSRRCRCRVDLDVRELRAIRDVGLGDALSERASAAAVHRLLAGPAIERRCFEVDWSSRETIKPCVEEWVCGVFAPTIEKMVAELTGSPRSQLSDQFRAIAVNRLGLSRVRALFDYVKRWPHSQGAILDVREFLATNGANEKAQLCSSFSGQMSRRLLHAGASTVEILSIYINVIHVFKLLDSRGVLLEKVAIPIRHYLRGREDTATIIAASLLADTDENGEVSSQDMDKICVDIALEIATSGFETDDDHSLRWNDMEWMPDPIDAGPDYKSTKADDILAYVLGLFEQDEFVKELMNFLSQHFLRSSDMEFTQETRLIELLKARLDPSKLQAAEVMLKDMRDSKLIGKRINPRKPLLPSGRAPTPREIQAAIPSEGITLAALYSMFEDRIKQTQFVAIVRLVANRRHELYYPKRTRLPPEKPQAPDVVEGPDFSVKVLSGFFWPALRTDSFDLPELIRERMGKYETGFSGLSAQRRLEWRPALSTVDVELELEDRTVEEKGVPAWRASVVDAFASQGADADPAPDMSVAELCETLNMDEELAADAVNFWLAKRVLYQTTPGRFAVLERLDMEVDAIEVDEQQPSEAISAIRTQDAMLQEGAPIFENFIRSMLQNSGPKEVGGMMGIAGMMKMVVSDFTFGEDGVEWLLGQMAARGEVTKNGEMWALAR